MTTKLLKSLMQRLKSHIKLRLTPALSTNISTRTRPIWVWVTLVLLTLLSAALAEGSLIKAAVGNNIQLIEVNELIHINHISQLSLLLVLGIVLVKGLLVINYFMGLKHTQGWPQRIMKGYLVLVLLLIGGCFIFY
ncbi:cytochrome C oxidase subunit IV family protein [Shewanella sp. OMA3-2]|uniref:cytochrome C oxidase subunit IV family protein n=1 Tax=Shewanella sp. OMA3-2 TaxID=2908650 RepID=UPI001F303F48|nr:cytochrome C oxidase subunit IV family protein [Shewanella sp. OMA3-2]UJF22717.1 cytochrome C oxidase subunit IV family protein [Shewanella sp. OMA3-2]